jgi:HEXXH motif-containing protein
MHLHLTALEQSLPLVKTQGVLFSPWRKEARSTGGVLHGLYVFSCIRAFLQIIIQQQWPSSVERRHMENRINRVNSDVKRVDISSLREGLSREGLLFLNAFHDCDHAVTR